ncbi:unnamed protein product, partial [marine sediment metagenome]
TVFDEIADWLDDAYDDLASSMCVTVDFDSIEVWNLTQDDLLGLGDWPTQTAGANDTNQMPPQCAALVLFNTSTARSQGRKFLPPFGVASQDTDGSVLAASLGNILLYANKLLVDITGTGWVGTAGNWNPVLVRFAAWTTNQIRDIFATQRRRYVGSGS